MSLKPTLIENTAHLWITMEETRVIGLQVVARPSISFNLNLLTEHLIEAHDISLHQSTDLAGYRRLMFENLNQSYDIVHLQVALNHERGHLLPFPGDNHQLKQVRAFIIDGTSEERFIVDFTFMLYPTEE